MSPKIARKVILEIQSKTDQHAAEHTLSERELQVLTGIARGQTYKEIGATMNRSSHTVHVYIKSAYEKLQACNRENGVSVQILTKSPSSLPSWHATKPAHRISRRLLPRDGAWQPA